MLSTNILKQITTISWLVIALLVRAETGFADARNQIVVSPIAAEGRSTEFVGQLFAGQSFVLNPGDRVRLDYTLAPSWRWKAIR